MMMAKVSGPELFVVSSLHCGLVWFHITFVLSALCCILAFSLQVWHVAYHDLELVGISWYQAQIINIENSAYPPECPIVHNSSISKLYFEFMYKVNHKNSEKSRWWWLLLLLWTVVEKERKKESLVSFTEGSWSSNPWQLEFSGFRRNRTDDLGIDSPSLWPTEPRLHMKSKLRAFFICYHQIPHARCQCCCLLGSVGVGHGP